MTQTKINQWGARAGGHIVAGDLNFHYPSPELADPQIIKEVEGLRRRRWFSEYDTIGQARILANRLQGRELAAGSDLRRSIGLAWCARVLAVPGSVEEARLLNAEARRLAFSIEVEIADAVILRRDGDKPAALSLLAGLADPAARSAALMLVAHHDGSEAAMSWVEMVELTAANFDPEGKHVLVNQQLTLGRWEDAVATAKQVNAEDNYLHSPVLRMSVALACLLRVVPQEVRHLAWQQVPFGARNFSLAADDVGVELRAFARARFQEAEGAFVQLQVTKAAALAKEYSLWLALEEASTKQEARNQLRNLLRKREGSLRWVPLAAQYDEELDLTSVEREIERQTVLCGGPTADGTMARLALAFRRSSPAEVAEYLSTHKEELLQHVDPKTYAFLEIEMLARAGQGDLAANQLAAARSLELSPQETVRLQHIIDEAAAEDIVGARRARFDSTGALADLIPLVDLLAEKGAWRELAKYAHLLFERDKSLPTAERYVEALTKIGQNPEAIAFLTNNAILLQQSAKIKMMKCWAQYGEGLLLEAAETLGELSAERETKNYRSLRQNIAVAMGDWNKISLIVAEDLENRNNRSARELIQAAHLALQVKATVAKDLLYAAAEKGQDDAAVLATAYFLASSADLEQDQAVGTWLQMAADMSDDKGPLFRTSLKDVLVLPA